MYMYINVHAIHTHMYTYLWVKEGSVSGFVLLCTVVAAVVRWSARLTHALAALPTGRGGDAGGWRGV